MIRASFTIPVPMRLLSPSPAPANRPRRIRRLSPKQAIVVEQKAEEQRMLRRYLALPQKEGAALSLKGGRPRKPAARRRAVLAGTYGALASSTRIERREVLYYSAKSVREHA